MEDLLKHLGECSMGGNLHIIIIHSLSFIDRL
jgi:hypothetical protein